MKELLLQKKGPFARYVLAVLMFVVTDVLQAFMIAMIFQAVVVGTMDYFWTTVAASVAFIIFNAAMFLGSRMLRIAFMRDILLEIRERAFGKILGMSFRGFNRKSREVYVSNLTNDINTIESNFFISLLNFMLRCGSYVVILTVLMVVEWRVGLIVFAVSLVVLGISKLFEDRTVRLQQEKSDENERFTVSVANTFSGLEILKLNSIERTFLDRAKKQVAELESKKMKFNFFTALQNHLNEAIGATVMFGLLVYLMYSPEQTIGLARLVLIIQLSSSCVFPLVRMLPLLNVLKSSDAIYRKITTAEVGDIETNGRPNPYLFKDRIDVHGLEFSYDQKLIFKGVDFTIEKGRKYLVAGPSGSGKTTLLKLLSMAYDDYGGTIAIDGVDLKSIKAKSFNENVSFVYQDVFLFEASIRENVALFKNVSEERIRAAVASAGLEDFVRAQAAGLDEPIAENGKNLSGGERQRISIARALCKNADILFADEASSSLNEELGRAVEETILSLAATVVAISHRYYPGTTDRYDYVLELRDGYVTQYPAASYFAEVNGHEAQA
jgi:ATP-binding cassette subfamily C protein